MKINVKIAGLALGMALAMTAGAGVASASNVDCTTPTATPDGSSTPGFTNLSFGVVYCGNDPFSGSGKGYINGSFSLAKIDIVDPTKTTDPNDGPKNYPGAGTDGVGPGDQSDAFSLSNLIYNGNDLIGGNWSFTPQFGEYYPTIMVIKAGSNFVLYSITAFATSGTFTTALLGGKNLSHISWYDGAGPCTNDRECGGGGNTPVPVPGALPLLATGIAGLGYIARRRRKA